MSKVLDIDISWGGFYASESEDSGKISIFCLLGFNKDAYHAALYSEEFEVIPTVDVIAGLAPFIGHAPIDSQELLNQKELVLIGSKPLARDDLDGYVYYLKVHGVEQEDIDEIVNSILNYSNEAPLKLSLEVVDDKLAILERK